MLVVVDAVFIFLFGIYIVRNPGYSTIEISKISSAGPG